VAAACDAGRQSDQRTIGPAITVTAINVGPDRPLPANGAIQLAFDRYLLPTTVRRQAFPIVDGNNEPLPVERTPLVAYDPVARTVTIRGQERDGWLTEGQLYKLVLLVPEGDSDISGVRAIDRATLDPAQPRLIEFFAGPPGPPPEEPAVSFCADVLPLFKAKCSVPTCHGSEGELAASGLVLETSAGVANTAIGRIAQGANTGGRTTRGGEVPGRVFGIDMPLVDPEHPENSWLIYKLELARLPVVDFGPKPLYLCSAAPEGPSRVPFRPLVPVVAEADEIERAILNDHVLGREMPYPAARVGSYEDQPLTFDEREKIRLWIAQGARVPECGGCDRSGGPASAAE
jgi:hypothetical protein